MKKNLFFCASHAIAEGYNNFFPAGAYMISWFSIRSFVVGAITLSCLPHAANAMDSCAYHRPALSFQTDTARTEYIRNQSSEDLTQMQDPDGESVVGGLGGGEIGFSTQAGFEVAEQGKQACLNLKTINVTFYAKPLMHIANNFDRGSCEYNAVVAHEKRHIETLLKFIREYTPKVHSEVIRILESVRSSYGPMPLTQTESLQTKIQSDFSSMLESYSHRIMPILSQRQEKVDTPEEYARVEAQCQKWAEKLKMEH